MENSTAYATRSSVGKQVDKVIKLATFLADLDGVELMALAVPQRADYIRVSQQTITTLTDLHTLPPAS